MARWQTIRLEALDIPTASQAIWPVATTFPFHKAWWCSFTSKIFLLARTIGRVYVGKETGKSCCNYGYLCYPPFLLKKMEGKWPQFPSMRQTLCHFQLRLTAATNGGGSMWHDRFERSKWEPLKTEKRLSAYSNEPLRSLLSLNNMQFSAHQLYFGVIHVNALANRSRQFNEIIFWTHVPQLSRWPWVVAQFVLILIRIDLKC